MSKNLHKFDNLSRKILIMTLKMTIESRVSTQNDLLIRFYKKYEKLVTHIECKGGQNWQNLTKNAIFANFHLFGWSKIR